MTPARRWTLTRAVLLAAIVGFAASGWYWFRPERALIDVRVVEPAPPAGSAVLARGVFVPGAHDGSGSALLMRLPDGRHVVRFTDFRTLHGPDVRVYLLGAERVANGDELRAAGYLDLGPLKGNVGDQGYEVPPGAEPGRYRAVSVWCRRFGVNFTTAVLNPAAPPRG